jgi:phenylacetate-CoA ligase
MGLTAADRVAFPFSFGPFVAFWTAFEAAVSCGMGVLPGGGMSTVARLRWLTDHAATVVFATPTYALHLCETAAAEGIDLPASAVRAVVVAGEPGGSIPATRGRLEAGWGARVFDHYGLTEVGPVANERLDTPGSLVVNEAAFIAEVLDPVDGVGELVVTNLGRDGCGLARYRTGDLVRAERRPDGLHLVGGVLGRADDMIHVRGNNVYPSTVEAIVRRFPWAGEFRLIADGIGPLTALRLEVEPGPAAPPDGCDQLAKAVRDGLLFRVPVTAVPPGTLPRNDLKSRRLVRIQNAK